MNKNKKKNNNKFYKFKNQKVQQTWIKNYYQVIKLNYLNKYIKIFKIHIKIKYKLKKIIIQMEECLLFKNILAK